MRQNQDKNSKQIMPYKVNISQYCSHSHREDEEFGSWEESYDNSFENVEKVSKNGYPDVLSIFDLQIGEEGFVVWMEYSTGDSFGYSTRGSVEPVGIFKDKKVAQELVDAINSWDPDKAREKSWDERNRFYFKTSDGQVFDYGFAPWSGYFENLDEVHINSFTLK